MVKRWRPTSKAQFSGLFATSDLQLARMTPYDTGTGYVIRLKPTPTWKSEPPYYCVYVFSKILRPFPFDRTVITLTSDLL